MIRLHLTRQRYRILAALLDTQDRYVKAAEIAQRTRLTVDIVHVALSRLEEHGWLDADGLPFARRTLNRGRGFRLTAHARSYVAAITEEIEL